jgi:thiamine biosynthesis lipoprotein
MKSRSSSELGTAVSKPPNCKKGRTGARPSLLRRARPLLGTIVDLACDGTPNDVTAAFAVMEKVHQLMSYFDSTSDVSRINRDAVRRRVPVHPWTWRVLQRALDFSRETDGVFDITAAHSNDGDWRDIALEANCAVRFCRPVIVDLGGIAKGFAVDRAVETLKKRKAGSGIVNAGGDIRVFGSMRHEIHLRSPTSPMQFCGALQLRDRAIATSATYFAPRALINGKTHLVVTDLLSVTVAAHDCMTADALTKIVFPLRERARPLLTRHHADALLLERNVSRSWMFHSLCHTRDQNRFA